MPDVEAIIKKYLPIEEGNISKLVEAMNYSVLAGGKRIRPIIMQEAYKLFGGTGKAIEPFMAAIEMIHNYSLIHDDLPAMDNDVIRRGKPSTWKAYGEATAILAGDALQTYAFETATKAFELSDRPDLVVRAIRVLAQKSGVGGMASGQDVDVQLAGKPIPKEVLKDIYKLKTGCLIEAAAMIGAIMAGADDQEISIIRRAAADMGLAFQIRDDILDVTGNTAETGKTTGLDERNVKTTYVTLYGVEEAQQIAIDLSKAAIEKIDKLPGDKAFFHDFINQLEVRKK